MPLTGGEDLQSAGIAEPRPNAPQNAAPPPETGGQPSGLMKFAMAILRRCGIDRAIAYTLAGRGWAVIATPVSWFLISRYLQPAEQGFYYTFGSVIALNIFFELGLTFVLVQFASHEKAHLEWTPEGTLTGPDGPQKRLAAVLRIALKWFAVAALLVIVIVMPAGILFFSRNSPATTVVWRVPWILLALASAANLVTSALLAFLEGCGKVSHVASLRLGQSVAGNTGLWIALRTHGALFASPVYQSIYVALALVWILVLYGRFFRSLFRIDVQDAPFNWWAEVWPFQWRIALSWLSGYFVFQLFNPVLFATRGPVVAGQMGMSVSVCNALVTVSFAWISTKASPFGVLVARRKWNELDTIFFRTVRQSMLVLLTSALVVFAAVAEMNHLALTFSTRLLAPGPFAFLLVAALMTHILYCEALYLRAHKAEPFLIVSVVSGILTAIATVALAKPFGATGVSIGYCACTAAGLLLGTWVFFRKRKEWHG